MEIKGGYCKKCKKQVFRISKITLIDLQNSYKKDGIEVSKSE